MLRRRRFLFEVGNRRGRILFASFERGRRGDEVVLDFAFRGDSKEIGVLCNPFEEEEQLVLDKHFCCHNPFRIHDSSLFVVGVRCGVFYSDSDVERLRISCASLVSMRRGRGGTAESRYGCLRMGEMRRITRLSRAGKKGEISVLQNGHVRCLILKRQSMQNVCEQGVVTRILDLKERKQMRHSSIFFLIFKALKINSGRLFKPC